jgi:hypothetical protein
MSEAGLDHCNSGGGGGGEDLDCEDIGYEFEIAPYVCLLDGSTPLRSTSYQSGRTP